MSESVVVAQIPKCVLCEHSAKKWPGLFEVADAKYDAALSIGCWAFVCEEHFQKFGYGLGTGRGQELLLEEPEDARYKREAEACIRAARVADDAEALAYWQAYLKELEQ